VSSSGSLGSGTYTYDGNGLRVKKVSGSTTTVYVFSGAKVIAEYLNGAAPGSPTREYIYSGSALLAKIEGGAANYYQADHLSDRVTTDANGSIVGQQGHYPYGESWYLTNTTTKWQFTSYERDAESGNDYAMARYDVNRLGRFSSPDPLAGSIGDPQSLNRYAYVGNDPLSNVDPLGLEWCRLDGVYIPCFMTGAMLRSGAVGLCPAGDDDCRKVRTGPNGQWQVCLREPCGNSDMSRWQDAEFVPPPEQAQQGGNSSAGSASGPPGQTPAPKSQQWQTRFQACMQRKADEANAGRAQFAANEGGRILRRMGRGAVIGGARGAYWGATAGAVDLGVGAVPGAAVGAVGGAVMGAGAAAIWSMVLDPLAQLRYDYFTYQPALDRASIECAGEADAAPPAPPQSGG
jgi:RHS repeat-associated protein